MSEEHVIDIVAISGSLRERSFNSALLRYAATIAPEGVHIRPAAIGGLPHFDSDLESRGLPAAAKALRDDVARADGLLIATPEYNLSVPGVLKNAIDWLSRGPDSPLDEKPTAILGAGGRSGTAHAQRHLREILTHNDVRVLTEPEVMVKGAWGHFDEELLPDAATSEAVGELIDTFIASILRVNEETQARPTLIGIETLVGGGLV